MKAGLFWSLIRPSCPRLNGQIPLSGADVTRRALGGPTGRSVLVLAAMVCLILWGGCLRQEGHVGAQGTQGSSPSIVELIWLGGGRTLAARVTESDAVDAIHSAVWLIDEASKEAREFGVCGGYASALSGCDKERTFAFSYSTAPPESFPSSGDVGITEDLLSWRLLNLPPSNQVPLCSPAGDMVAAAHGPVIKLGSAGGYQHLGRGGASSDAEVWIVGLSPPSKSRIRISPRGALGAIGVPVAWSPDESMLAMVRTEWVLSGERVVAHSDLWVTNSDGTSVRRLTSCGDVQYSPITWSPTGDRVIFARRGARGHNSRMEQVIILWAVQVSDGKLAQLVSAGDLRGARVVSVSPDASRAAVVIARGHSSRSSLYVIDVLRRQRRYIAEGAIGLPVWGPSGGKLAFVRDGDEVCVVRLGSAVAGKVEVLWRARR